MYVDFLYCFVRIYLFNPVWPPRPAGASMNDELDQNTQIAVGPVKLIDVKGISAARSVGALLEQIPRVDFTLAVDWLDFTLALDWLEKKLSQNLIYTGRVLWNRPVRTCSAYSLHVYDYVY